MEFYVNSCMRIYIKPDSVQMNECCLCLFAHIFMLNCAKRAQWDNEMK